MADPQNPQAIENTPAAGHVTLPDGRVVPTLDTYFNQQANNPAGFDTSQQRTKISQGYTNNIAGPATDMLGNFISSFPPSKLAEKVGLLAPETNQAVSRGIASAAVPQNLTQLGVLGGIAAGGAGGAALGLGPWMSAGTRLMGATAGGMAGGATDTGDVKGALSGAGQGIASAVPAESVGALWDYSRTLGVQRARAAIQKVDAENVAQVIPNMSKLKGALGSPATPADLEDLAKGAVVVKDPATGRDVVWPKGVKMLSDYVEKQDAQVLAMLQQQQSQYGRTYKFPDALNPGTFTDWDTARKNLSELGRKAFGGAKGQPLEPTIAGVDSKQLYAETQRLLKSQLTLADPSGAALAAFNDGQGAYEAGRYLLKNVLRPAFSKKGASGPEFNSDVVSSKLADNRVSAMKKLGVQEYQDLARAVRLQMPGEEARAGLGPMGSQDVFNPGGALAKISEILPLPGPAYARVHLGRPDLVGGNQTPLNLSQAARTGVSLGGSQAMGAGLQLLNNGQPGIPGLR